MEKIKVFVVDDHPLIREGLARVLQMEQDIEIVGEAAGAQEALAKIVSCRPGVVLMDIYLPDGSGIEVARQVKQSLPQTRVIFLTVALEEEQAGDILLSGADGCILKDIEPQRLVNAIRAVANGDKIFHPSLMEKLAREIKKDGEEDVLSEPLTEREKEILALLVRGKSNREIAAQLFISEKTVKNHLTHIFRKIGVEDRTQAAIFALQKGLVEDKKLRR